MRTQRRGLFVAALALLAAGVPATVAHSDTLESVECVRRTHPPAVGAELLDRTRTGRLETLKIRSTAVGEETRHAKRGEQLVNVLLPEGFDPTHRYPVLYLLHGFSGSYIDYVESTDVVGAVGDRQVIVVMPDDGYNGSYSDWYGRLPGVGGDGQPPAWERFHIDELIPLIDATYPTIRDRAGRGVAGISAGGFGAMKYAAEYPQLFGAAGSMSGALDITMERDFGADIVPWYATVNFALNSATLVPGTGPASHCVWGDPYTEEIHWRTNNPTELGDQLEGTAIWLSSGDGGDAVEDGVRAMHLSFSETLDAAGIAHTNVFRPGTHTAAFWIEDLRALLPWFMDQFASPVGAPSDFDLRSAEPVFGAWGWSFHSERHVEEFTYLEDVSSDGLTATGSGSVLVVTPPLARSGTYEVAGAGDGAPRLVTTGDDGRLRFRIDLGPSHILQQTYFGPGATTDWVTRHVSLEPVRLDHAEACDRRCGQGGPR